jgi:MoaA/NifB/PqqE/SkfB family radical SAM enzyme
MNYPTRVQIGVSYRCNVHCKSCLQGARTDGPLMSYELFERVLPMVTVGCEVQLFGRGEPLLHPRFCAMVAAVTARGGVAYTTTNGTLLTAEMVRGLSDAGLRSVSVSVHGADRETHERLQAGADSEAVWRGIRLCQVAGIDVILATVVMQSTLSQLLPIAERGKVLGVKGVTWLRLMHDGSLDTEDPFLPDRAQESWARIGDLRRQLPVGVVYYDNLGRR